MSCEDPDHQFVAICNECGWEKEAKTLEEARRLATLHIRTTSCLLAFGYPCKKNGIQAEGIQTIKPTRNFVSLIPIRQVT